MSITVADITRITLLKLCGDPESLAQALSAAASGDEDNDGSEAVKDLLEFCKAEGIDPLPAVKKAIQFDVFR